MKNFMLNKSKVKGIEGVDYEILSIGVCSEDYDFMPYGRAFRKNLISVIGERGNKSLLEVVNEQEKNHPFLFLQQSKPLYKGQDIYLLQDGMLNFDNAYDCGFGIIQMLRGNHTGEFFLYNSENEDEDVAFMLDLYLLLTVKIYHNKSIEDLVSTRDGRMLIRSIQKSDDIDLCQKIDMACIGKKNRTNIISYSQIQKKSPRSGK